MDNNALPVDILQKIFVESYGLKKYWLTIMQSRHFNFEIDELPVYYSFQYPAMRVFSPRSRLISSTINEIRELKHLMTIFNEELSKDGAIVSDTVIGQIAKSIKYHYFHNTVDTHKIIGSSMDILMIDSRFNRTLFPSASKAEVASDASFLRGCISIGLANTNAK